MQRVAPHGLRRDARVPPGAQAASLNREKALAALNGRLLREFSRRTVASMRIALPLRVALPMLESFLAENVEKEVRKDACVIHCAAVAVGAGRAPAPEAIRQLLAAAREIDRQFLAGVGRFPVRIDIPYGRIEPLRRRRIELGLELACRMLDAWKRGERARSVLPRDELASRVRGLLDLYAEEVLELSRSVGLPAPLALVRERVAGRLRSAMSEAARAMTAPIL